jgi:hypothetical protein
VEEFLEVVLIGYVLRATALELGTSVEDTFEETEKNSMDIQTLAAAIVDRLTNLTATEDKDVVVQHTKELCTLVFTWYHYRDITREGDGERLLQLTPLLLQIFRGTRRYNYSKEITKFIVQCQYLSSERLRTQLLYSRYVNNHGRVGKNVACDLHMEHLNRYDKQLKKTFNTHIASFLLQRSKELLEREVL